MKEHVSVFKVRIDSVETHAIGFELFAGEKVSDTYINILAKGSYGNVGRILLTPKQFADLCQRLIAYVYLGECSSFLSDDKLKILWDLRLNIFDSEVQQTSGSIFSRYRKKLIDLGLVRGKNDRKKSKIQE